MSTPVDPFTERMARAQDSALDRRGVRDEVRARLLAGDKPRVDRSDRRLFVAGGAGVTAAVAAAAAISVWLVGSSDLRVQHAGADLAVGAWIDASEAPATLDFSDGTRVVLAAGSTARLASMDRNGASLQLERGTAELDVVHTDDAHWEVHAGPFAVEVTGTAFQTQWSPDGEVFRVQMREGSVLVTGPHLGGARRIGGTEFLEVDLVERRGQITMADPDPVAPEVVPEPRAAPAAAPAEAAPEGEGTEVPDWHASYLANDHQAALEQVEAVGLVAVLAAEGADRLVDLADAAKLARRSDVERQVWQTVRTRFGGTRAAADAAYGLARLDQDVERDLSSAANWFRTAHDEGCSQPSLALGLHLMALHQSGDSKGAKKAAIEYMERYPDGAHATLAEGIAPRRR